MDELQPLTIEDNQELFDYLDKLKAELAQYLGINGYWQLPKPSDPISDIKEMKKQLLENSGYKPLDMKPVIDWYKTLEIKDDNQK